MKNVIAALALVAAPALADSGHDVGVAGVDYEKLIDPVVQTVRGDVDTIKACGQGSAGCAILGFARDENNERYAVCRIFVKARTGEETINHEMKHCFGYTHAEMPKHIRKKQGAFQRDWIERNHKIWSPLPAKTLKLLRGE